MMKRNTQDLIPLTSYDQVPEGMTEDEAHEFWSTHEITDAYLASAPSVPDDDLPPFREPSKYQAIHLRREVFEKVRRLARVRGSRVDDLINDLVSAALNAEGPRDRVARRSGETRIDDIEGIGPAYATRLKGIGIGTVERLLEEGATRAGRKTIAEAAGVRDDQVLRWVNHADLLRIKGVAVEFAELLEAAGVDSVPDLAQRSPANLQKRMAEVNEQKKLTRRVPGETQVRAWIAEAKTLGRAIRH